MSSNWKNVYFRSHVNIKNIIGKELINDDNVAVMELVKNSYDAGARTVTVEFRNLKYIQEKHELLIVDDGCGMSLDDLLNKWLNLAYSIKRIQNAQNNRLQAGNKGIGRFSCDRLGKKLDIYTKKNSQVYQLQIDWEDFEGETDFNIEINQIPIKLRELPSDQIKKETGHDIQENGTIIKISDLRIQWVQLDGSLFNEVLNYQKFVSLKSALEKLVNKSQVESDDFKIFLQVNDIKDEEETSYNKKINGEIKNRFFEKLHFNTTYIHSAISEDGNYIITKLKDRDKVIYQVVEENIEFPTLKNIKIILMHLNPYGKAYFKKQMGVRSVDFGSIYLFINGFRIPPYGEVDNDAFGIEIRKGQGQRRYLGGRDIIGRIEIEDRGSEFKVISSREGIEQNESFMQLIHKSTRSSVRQIKNNGFFYKTLKRLEKYVVQGLKWDSVSTRDFPEVKIDELVSRDDWCEDKEQYVLSRDTKLQNISKRIFSFMGLNPKKVVDLDINNDVLSCLGEIDSQNAANNLSKFLSELGQIPQQAINHNLREHLVNLVANIKDDNTMELFSSVLKNKLSEVDESSDKEQLYSQLNNKIKILESEQEYLKQELETVQIQKKKIEEQISYLRSVQSKDVSELIAFQHHIGLYTKTAKDCILDVIDVLKNNKEKEQIIFEYLKDASFELDKISLINKYITRENFLSTTTSVTKNLIKFIEDYIKDIYEITTNKELAINIQKENIEFICNFEPIKINIIIDNLLNNSKKAKAKNVNIFFRLDNQCLELRYCDDGKGFDKNITNISSIFEMGFTTTKGSGLGLYHVKELLEEMNASTIEANLQKIGIEFIIRFNL